MKIFLLALLFVSSWAQAQDSETIQHLLVFPKLTLPFDTSLTALQFAKDAPGKLLVATAAGNIEKWDVLNNKREWQHNMNAVGCASMVFSNDGSLLLVTCYKDTVQVLKTSDGTFVREYKSTRPSDFQSGAFSPDDQLVAAGDLNGVINIWDQRAGQLIGRLVGHDYPLTSLAFSSDGQLLLSSDNQTIRLWSVREMKEIRKIQDLTDGGEAVFWHDQVRFTPDMKSAMASSDNKIYLYSLANGSLMGTYKGHPDQTVDMQMSRDLKRIYSIGLDTLVRITDVGSGEDLYSAFAPLMLGMLSSAAIDPDGKLIALGSTEIKLNQTLKYQVRIFEIKPKETK